MTQINSGIWRTMERQSNRFDTIDTYKPPKHSKRTTGNVWHSNGSVMDNFKATKAQRDAAFHDARDLSMVKDQRNDAWHLMNSFRL